MHSGAHRQWEIGPVKTGRTLSSRRNLLDVSVDALSYAYQALLVQMSPHWELWATRRSLWCQNHVDGPNNTVLNCFSSDKHLYLNGSRRVWAANGYCSVTMDTINWIRNSGESVSFCLTLLWENRVHTVKLLTTDISGNFIWKSESYWIHQYFVLLSVLSGFTA